MKNFSSIQLFGRVNFLCPTTKKMPLSMKLSAIMLFVFIGMAYATESYSQSIKLNIEVSNQTVQNVLDEIEKRSEFRFFYNNSQVNTSRKVTIKSGNKDVFTLLEALFAGTNVTYKILDKSIILSPKEVHDKVVSIVSTTPQQVEKKLTGMVTDIKGEAIIGANLIVKGASSNGTITDIEGRFRIVVPAQSTLLVSYIGYVSKEVPVGNQTVLNIQLAEDTKNLEEVVVTALGIRREEKALGYAVQKVKTDGLTSSKGVDIASSLTGKVAGLNIQNSTEFNEAPVMKLRGETPLLIIDGIPYGKMSLSEIASDDILSIDVLKGATASALYGSRGSGGAIMVTTKKGTPNEGINVEVNSNTMFFSGFLAFPQVQSAYSLGSGGKYGSDYVWGDKLDIGRTAVQYDPRTYEWREMELTSKGKNNFKNFLQLSMVTNNNVSVSQQGKYGSFRASLTHVYNKGQYPNQDLNKMTFSVGGDMSYKNFKLEAAASYNKRLSSNDNGSGYSGSYIYDMVIWGGTEYDVREYKDYWVKEKEGQQQNWYDGRWYDNPWFKANEVVSSSDYDIMNAYVNGSYAINPWLKAMLRAGLDSYSQKNQWRNAMSANGGWEKKGYYGIRRTTGYSLNTDAILMADKSWGKFALNGLVGGNIYFYSEDRITSETAGGLTIPAFYSLQGSIDPIKGTSVLKRKQVNSLYGKLSLSWASTYFIDVTGRNDWASTLPAQTRSYFYPSVAGSIVLSEILSLPNVWNFWKVRGSWTQSKEDMGVYDNNNVYEVKANVWDGMGTAHYPSTLIGASVRPKLSNVLEVGTAVNFFNNRLYADFAYFRKVESDFIISGGISAATGFNAVQVNFKEERLRNGMELTIGGTPIKTRNVQWDILTNWGRDRYSYLKIDPEYSNKKPWVKEGESWDWFEMNDWDRDPQGNIIHNGGIPVKQTFKTKVGNLTPDLVWGISNTLRYKAFTLNVTIDGRIGGMSFSRTHQMLWNSGAHEDSDNQWRYDEVVNGKKTYVGSGVKVVSGKVERDADGNIISDDRVFAPNDVVVSYESYISTYHDATSKPSRQNVLDETFFKLRNLSLTFELPEQWTQKLKMKNASVGLTGQNLFLWAKDYKYADPDKGGDSGGYENLNSPSQRYVGFNLKANF